MNGNSHSPGGMATRRCVAMCWPLALLLSSLAASASAADWSQWLGPNRDGVSSETTRLADRPDPKEIWRASVGLGPSSPVVAGGRCWVMGYTGGLEDPHGTDTVWCLSAETGEIVWKHSYDCKGCESQDVKFAGPRATPTVDGNAVFTLSLLGQPHPGRRQTRHPARRRRGCCCGSDAGGV